MDYFDNKLKFTRKIRRRHRPTEPCRCFPSSVVDKSSSDHNPSTAPAIALVLSQLSSRQAPAEGLQRSTANVWTATEAVAFLPHVINDARFEHEGGAEVLRCGNVELFHSCKLVMVHCARFEGFQTPDCVTVKSLSGAVRKLVPQVRLASACHHYRIQEESSCP
jgi:hypothetical protein